MLCYRIKKKKIRGKSEKVSLINQIESNTQKKGCFENMQKRGFNLNVVFTSVINLCVNKKAPRREVRLIFSLSVYSVLIKPSSGYQSHESHQLEMSLLLR